MNKNKITFDKRKNIIVKFNNYKIEVKPYLEFDEVAMISQILHLNYFDEERSSEERFVFTPLLNYLYAYKVCEYCTNIDLEGVDFELVYLSGLSDFLRDNIQDYDLIFNNILIGIRERNIENSFSIIAKAVPNAKEQEESIKNSVSYIEKMVKDGKFQTILNENIKEMSNTIGTKNIDVKSDDFKNEVKNVLKKSNIKSDKKSNKK